MLLSCLRPHLVHQPSQGPPLLTQEPHLPGGGVVGRGDRAPCNAPSPPVWVWVTWVVIATPPSKSILGGHYPALAMGTCPVSFGRALSSHVPQSEEGKGIRPGARGRGPSRQVTPEAEASREEHPVLCSSLPGRCVRALWGTGVAIIVLEFLIALKFMSNIINHLKVNGSAFKRHSSV